MEHIFITVKEYLESGVEPFLGQEVFTKKQDRFDLIGLFYNRNKNKLIIKSNNNSLTKLDDECYLKFNLIKNKK